MFTIKKKCAFHILWSNKIIYFVKKPFVAIKRGKIIKGGVKCS